MGHINAVNSPVASGEKIDLHKVANKSDKITTDFLKSCRPAVHVMTKKYFMYGRFDNDVRLAVAQLRPTILVDNIFFVFRNDRNTRIPGPQ